MSLVSRQRAAVQRPSVEAAAPGVLALAHTEAAQLRFSSTEMGVQRGHSGLVSPSSAYLASFL